MVSDDMPNDGEYMSWVGDYWAINKVSLPSAWDYETGDSTILVGVIDTGIDGTHPDLQNRVNTTLSQSFTTFDPLSNGLQDQNGHGTMAAGIIGAEANNSSGVAGVCWNVQLVSLKVSTSPTSDVWDIDSVVSAIYEAEEQGIPIINLSGSTGYNSEELLAAILWYDGLIVCSAGNNGGFDLGDFYPSRLVYPACFEGCDNVLVVGASTETDAPKSSSARSATYVDLFAPGVNILTTFPTALCNAGCNGNHDISGNNEEGNHRQGYHYFQNTSAATPFVTGVAALVLAQNPTYTPAQIKSRILNSVDEVDALDGYCVTGGRLNAFNALHSHSYTYRYVSLGQSGHNAYCSCGDYVVDTHLFVTSGGGTRCSKCNYRLN
jgi:subtilisin family serine protease